MTTYGFSYTGDSGQLILGDDNPVLVQRYIGKLKVTKQAGIDELRRVRINSGKNEGYVTWRRLITDWGYGWCEIQYPAMITTQLPPFVFGVPNGAARGGIGMFAHVGSPGAWTGFKCCILGYLWGGNRPRVLLGHDPGWDYRVCTFGAPPSRDEYGMRIWDEQGQLVFDAGWPLVFFRELLTTWSALNTGTRYYNIRDYWGNPVSGGDVDEVMQVFGCPWGYQDGQAGVLLSSLSNAQVRGDTGDDNTTVSVPPFIGLAATSRSRIHVSYMYGLFQHPCTAGGTLPHYRFLTADFSKAGPATPR